MSVLDEIAIAHAKHVHERFERVRLGAKLILEQSTEFHRLLLEYGGHKALCVSFARPFLDDDLNTCNCGWAEAHAQIKGKPE